MNKGTSDQTRILNLQRQNQSAISATKIANTLKYTLANQEAITAMLQSQRTALKDQRYIPFQPYYPPVEPVSVTQLRQATANVGAPMSFVMKCKGVQSVTK
jgi:hypothetical protein